LNVEGTKFGVALVNPVATLMTITFNRFAIGKVSGQPNFEEVVFIIVEGEGELAGGIVSARLHDTWIQNGDNGARDSLVISVVGGAKEEEFHFPFQVGEGEDHVLV